MNMYHTITSKNFLNFQIFIRNSSLWGNEGRKIVTGKHIQHTIIDRSDFHAVQKFFITSALSERCFEVWCPLPNVKSVTQAISTRPSMYSTMSFMRVGCSLLISSQPSISRSRLPY